MTKKQKFPYLLGSKWTAQQKVDGWRHFQVVNRKNQGKWVYAEMVAACDPQVPQAAVPRSRNPSGHQALMISRNPQG
jgi:tryptophan-rich hypothetical protein